MKVTIFFSVLLCLFLVDAKAQQDLKAGLKGEYYNGTNFERKVMSRIDPQLSFTWKTRSPATGVDKSYYSIRWTGKLLAPVSGKYTFNAKVDDGIRIWVGNRKVMDVWKLNDSGKFTGSIELEAGQVYDLRVDYFNDMLGGVIELYWVRPDAEKPFLKFGEPIGELISSRYFQQAAPRATPKPVVVSDPVVTLEKPPVKRSPSPKPINKPQILASDAKQFKPIYLSPLPTSVQSSKPVATSAVAESTLTEPAPVDAGPVVLKQVRFEQSSYILLPESFPELDKLVDVLREHPQWRIQISGHTDNVGDPRLNRPLSEYRARVVMNYLIQHGIAEDRIDSKGYGGARPIAENDTEAGRATNRRVEFELMK